MNDHVVLLHGIWMRGFTMAPFARRLRAAGFASLESFDYASVSGDFDLAVDRLAARMRAVDGPVHLVGHSLGGMLAVETLLRRGDLPPGRVVCLGAPLRGSAAARGVDKVQVARWVMGRSAPILTRGFERWDGARELGIVAGRTPLGLGRFFGRFDGPNDGTVSVEETQLPGATDHRIVASTHSGLVFSDEVAALTASFLRAGRFPPAA
ncbi:esterase/lipase family protein [Dokdonella sp. MW10]|uniref:esterase/lipase family protein n=1 Tax=Dokdonella sp. MW10 TaxID=2992926 RepID=UPI003F7E3F25